MTRSIWIFTAAGLLSACNNGEAQQAETAAAPAETAAMSEQIISDNKPQTEAERIAFSAQDQSPLSVVNRFNQMAFFDHKPADAMRLFLADSFIERSPDFARDGAANDKEGAIAYFDARGWNEGDPLKDTIYQVIAEENRVVVFHKVTRGPEDAGSAYVDIFRVEDGLIEEHWAVGQPVPDTVTQQHSMF